MAEDIRDYLIDRFRADASTLRKRADSLAVAAAQQKKQGGKPAPGPDANVSRAMADACDNVVALAEGLPVRASVDDIVVALKQVLPALTAHAASPVAQKFPPVRAVYVGASTRISELIVAEQNAAGGGTTNGAAASTATDDEDEEDDE